MPLNNKYTSVKRVIENLYRDYGFKDYVTFESAIEHIADAIDLIGVPIVYIDKITNGVDGPDPIEIVDYRGDIPCDFISEIQIREWDSKVPLIPLKNNFNKTHSFVDLSNDYRKIGYKIEGSYIFTDYDNISLELVYKAFRTDDDGLPLIPDDTRYLKAVTAYIAERVAFKLYLQGMLDERRYDRINREWLFYVNSAATRAHTPSIPEMETLKNQIQRLIQSPSHFGKGFMDLGQQEQLII